MLFNSVEFITVYLPVTLILFYVLAHGYGALPAKVWLAASSFFFYAWWDAIYLLLLIPSILFNYGLGAVIRGDAETAYARSLNGLFAGFAKRRVLIFGIVVNLALIAYFKYYNFFISNVNALTGAELIVQHIILPLGISFFTFTQITYLVDSHMGKVKAGPLVDYMLFVNFFPHLIAGPIVHHGDILDQFKQESVYRWSTSRFTDGLIVFTLGLGKKVILADPLGSYADIVFNGAGSGQSPTFFAAWTGVMAYTLQLYFDFSGYSDMAIGLGRMFGIEFPRNFNSPYKSASIIDFWRRWHMTLSRFLREYIYIPLGGNKFGESRRYTNLMTTMLLGGLWHGSAWTFVAWGGLHGLYLVINNIWNKLRDRKDDAAPGGVASRVLGVGLTFLAVSIGWVFFRATTWDSALVILEGMVGVHGAPLPKQVVDLIPGLSSLVQGVGRVPLLGDNTVMGMFEGFGLIGLGLAIVFFTPNIYEMSARWRLICVGISFPFVVQKIFFSTALSPFLYFQF